MVTTGVPQSFAMPQVSGGLSNETFDQLLAESAMEVSIAEEAPIWMVYVMEIHGTFGKMDDLGL